MIDRAKRRYLNEPLTKKLNFITGNAYHLPFDDATVDGITATSLAGCLSSPDKFFEEMYRVLRQGGFAVMTFTNRTSWLLKTNSYLRRIMPSTGQLRSNNFAFRIYRDNQVTESLEKTGFTVTEIRFYNYFLNWGDRLLPPVTWAIRAENLKNSKVQRRLARNFIITAQKV